MIKRIFLLFVFATSLWAQQKIDFDRFSIEHGLSQITIHSIIQDNLGFMWFATEGGINRFDGYQFTNFKHDRKNPNSLPDNFVWDLFQDQDGFIWIGTNNGGLSKFNPHTYEYTNFQSDRKDPQSISSNSIRAIKSDSQNGLWIGTDNSINHYDGKSFSKYFFPIFQNEVVPIVIELYLDNGNNLWIGTNKGLFILKKESEEIEHVKLDANEQLLVNQFIEDDSGKILIGTSKGIWYYNSETREFLNERLLSNEVITSLEIDENNTLWIGTEEGIYLFEKGEEFQQLCKYNTIDPKSISNNLIREIYEDKTGNIWIGTAGGGVNKYSPNKRKFNHLFHMPGKENSLNHDMIRAIYEDREGIVWIGTLGGGLNKWDRKYGIIEHFTHDRNNSESISSNGITAIYEDRKGDVWIGTWGGGINRLIKNGGRKVSFAKYLFDNQNTNTISSNIIQAIAEDREGNMWIGTEAGLDKFDPSRNTFVHYKLNEKDESSISDNRIQSNCIVEGKNGDLFIGTWNGLNIIPKSELRNAKNNKPIKFTKILSEPNDTNSLSDNRVISIYIDKKERIWIGTHGGGLNMLIIDDGGYSFKNYSMNNGLPSDVIYGILEDEKGYLWLSTNNGLASFNSETNDIKIYSQNDGLQSNQFYWGSFCKGADGTMYFGGINGVNYFRPSELSENKNIPPVYITDVNIFNKSLFSAGKYSFPFVDKLNLDYKQNVIMFEFAALDYTISQENKYKYMLEGYDREWREAKSNKSVTYSISSYGNYKFKVLGANNDGTWNEKGAEIQVYFEPPFWETWWFYILLVSVLGSSFAYFVFSYVRQLLAVERLRTKLAADLHDNIGSSLTEISILSEVISTGLPEENKDARRGLTMISEKARWLVDEMSDIVWLVNPKRDSLYDLILRLEDTYSEIMAYKGISFRAINLKALQSVSLTMEQRQNIFLIFKEAINNSINHSECSELILRAKVTRKRLKMVLEDDGSGFDLDEKKNKSLGNGLTNMESRGKKIGGKVKIVSEAENGTKIRFEGSIL